MAALTPVVNDPVEFQYQRLADEIEQRIMRGSYAPGDKLPSLRSVHAQTGLSMTTVYRAFQALEDRGIVETREKSGFYVRPLVRHILPLPVIEHHEAEPKHVRVNILVDTIIHTRSDLATLHLGTGVPAPELLPLKRLTTLAKKAADMYREEGGLSYGPPNGIAELIKRLPRSMLDGHPPIGCRY